LASVRLLTTNGREIGRGICGLSSEELRAILGLGREEIRRRLGEAGSAVVHRDHLVLTATS
jgi:glutamate 5-kinase